MGEVPACRSDDLDDVAMLDRDEGLETLFLESSVPPDEVEGDARSIETREKSELASDLESVAERLDLIRGQLCPVCCRLAVVERVAIEGGGGRKKRE